MLARVGFVNRWFWTRGRRQFTKPAPVDEEVILGLPRPACAGLAVLCIGFTRKPGTITVPGLIFDGPSYQLPDYSSLPG